MNFKTITLYILGLLMISISSCVDFVEDGIEVDYEDSNAELLVNALGSTGAAENETVSFTISVKSDFDIKSCIVRANVEGKNGSGFNVSDLTYDDPFADHNFGTIREDIQDFTVRYDYIVPEGLNKARISVTIIDESGRVQEEVEVESVPSITLHENLVTYAKDNTFHDAIASGEGKVYNDVKSNYSTFTSENVTVQEKIDIIFYYNKSQNNSVIAAPAFGGVNLELSIENATSFKKMDLPADLDLGEMSASELQQITSEANLFEDGNDFVDRVKVGDIIGFITDVNAITSLKKGLLKVEGLHPGSVARYTGTSYVLECSILIQN